MTADGSTGDGETVAQKTEVDDLRRAWESSEEECAKLRRSNDGWRAEVERLRAGQGQR